MSIVLLTGGIGGAKLALGLQMLGRERVTAIVNTADDFEHLGLSISPDIDTLTYTLAGLDNRELGWGRADESWNFMAALKVLGAADWFMLGDRDLALHVERTRRLRSGESLSRVTDDFARRLGAGLAIAPMSDDPVRTMVITDRGGMTFQRYFVAERCAPVLRSVRFAGASAARPSARALAALADPSLEAIIIAPSNPWLSIDPILAVPGMREAIVAARAPVVAVTPLPGGRAVKGPTAKIMSELNLALSVESIAAHYEGLIDALLIDAADPAIVLSHARCDTVMHDDADRIRVARATLALAGAR